MPTTPNTDSPPSSHFSAVDEVTPLNWSRAGSGLAVPSSQILWERGVCQMGVQEGRWAGGTRNLRNSQLILLGQGLGGGFWPPQGATAATPDHKRLPGMRCPPRQCRKTLHRYSSKFS